nr:MAG TPA: hypothetical protein [Caudoviricetes sp.]
MKSEIASRDSVSMSRNGEFSGGGGKHLFTIWGRAEQGNSFLYSGLLLYLAGGNSSAERVLNILLKNAFRNVREPLNRAGVAVAVLNLCIKGIFAHDFSEMEYSGQIFTRSDNPIIDGHSTAENMSLTCKIQGSPLLEGWDFFEEILLDCSSPGKGIERFIYFFKREVDFIVFKEPCFMLPKASGTAQPYRHRHRPPIFP